jgi:hypothetical protein
MFFNTSLAIKKHSKKITFGGARADILTPSGSIWGLTQSQMKWHRAERLVWRGSHPYEPHKRCTGAF